MQNGRSMIEMLSVLAIIAVLTIVGINGFSYAKSQHTANLLSNDARNAAFITVESIFSKLSYMETLDLNNQIKKETSFPFSVTRESLSSFVIEVKEVPQKVCTHVINQSYPWSEEVIASNDSGCSDDLNTISFYVNLDFSSAISNTSRKQACAQESDCGECGKCENGFCSYDDGLCTNNTHCIFGVCSACPKGQTTIDGSCKNCYDTEDAFYNTEKGSCQKCPNRFYSGEETNYCISCAHLQVANASSKEECLKCNLTNNKRYWKNGLCYSCTGMVSADGGECYLACPEGLVQSSGSCVSCDTEEILFDSTKESCAHCPNKFYQSFGEKNGYCLACDHAYTAQNVDKESCLKCNLTEHKRTWNNGNCDPCQGTLSQDATTCTLTCTGSNVVNNGMCSTCTAEEYYFGSTQVSCHNCEGHFYQGTGDANPCLPCSHYDAISVSDKAECERCPNRYYTNNQCMRCDGTVTENGTKCVLECLGTTVYKAGVCTECVSEEYYFNSNQTSCHNCEGHFYQGAGDGNVCLPCSHYDDIPVSDKAECTRCSGRYYQNGLCKKCSGTVGEDKESCN